MTNIFEISSYIHKYYHQSYSSINKVVDVLLAEDNLELVVIDNAVFEKFLELGKLKKNKNIYLVKLNQSTKSIKNLVNILDVFSSKNLKKHSEVAVIGGGTLQDIIASACCMYFRGLKWIFVPTTVLSQGDSCVGSKTSIDSENSKNQYGFFYPPKKILACKEFLTTLDFIELISGFGDVLHYLLPYNSGISGLKQLIKSLNNSESMVDLASNLSQKAMFVKSKMVEIDEFDTFERYIFNYGHTFGHSLEKSSDKYLPHGVGVLFGILIANSLSKIKECLKEQNNLIEKLINDVNSLGYLDNYTFSIEKITKQLKKDKKNDNTGLVKCIVPCPISESVWICPGFKSFYGLKAINLSIGQCLTAILEIDRISGVSFID